MVERNSTSKIYDADLNDFEITMRISGSNLSIEADHNTNGRFFEIVLSNDQISIMTLEFILRLKTSMML